MFIRCLCIPTIWHYYVGFSFLFVFHKKNLRGSSDGFSFRFYHVLCCLPSLHFCSQHLTCASFTIGDRVLVIVDCVGSYAPFTILSALGIDYRRSIKVCCTKAYIMLVLLLLCATVEFYLLLLELLSFFCVCDIFDQTHFPLFVRPSCLFVFYHKDLL